MCMYHPGSMLKNVFTGLLLLASGLVCGQDFTTINHAYLYRQDVPVKSELMVWQAGSDSLEAMASLHLREDRDLASLRVYLYPCRELTAVDEIYRPIRMLPAASRDSSFLFQAKVSQTDSIRFLVLQVQDSLQEDMNYWSMITLDEEYNFPPSPFYLTQQDGLFPAFQSYIKTRQDIQIKGNEPSYTLFYYPEAFDPAAPPMSSSGNSSATMELGQTLEIPGDSVFSLWKEGLYFVQHDTSQLSGQSFRLTNQYFPEVGTITDFAGPIRYLSTNEEWERLKAASFDKKQLDRFWLKIAQTEDRAKRIIKTYYDRVAWANELFTNYKEGWKTDQGMIYVLYGNPDNVQILPDREVWIYSKTADLPEIKFTFVRVKNPFSDSHMVLLRNKNYTKAHYQIVSQWRRGRRTL